jgi:hypothetical protein
MKKYIGKDARYIAVDDGPPVNVFDMPDGRRAFQYRWGGGSYVVPKTTTSQGQIQLVGDGAYYSEQKVETGGFAVESSGCLITYFAEWNPAKKGWIVVDISYPKRLVC